jgi:hypothetical protein
MKIGHRCVLSVYDHTLKANSHVMPHSCPITSHTPCRAPAILWLCRVLCESPCGSLTDWYVSNNNFHGTLSGSWKKPKAGRSPTCSVWKTGINSHMPCHSHAVTLRSCFQSGMVVAWHRRGMTCVNQTRPHCTSNGKDTIWTLSGMAWQGNCMGAAGEWHGMCELVFIVWCNRSPPKHFHCL